MATEEAQDTVIAKGDKVEIRQYASHVVAETVIKGQLEEAGNAAFKPLFDYISGNNTTQTDIAMTAPVSQQAASEKIAMTAPVSQQQAENGWAISFMMPASYTLDTLPKPNNPKVELKAVPEKLIASIRYSGFWSEKNYLQHKKALEDWIKKSDYQADGQAVWARYNAPFTPWFLRRNEVLIPVVEMNTQ
jgi:effector-binding domain-containing protein